MSATAPGQILELDTLSCGSDGGGDRTLPVVGRDGLRFVRDKRLAPLGQDLPNPVGGVAHRSDSPGEDRVVDHRDWRASTALLNASSIG